MSESKTKSDSGGIIESPSEDKDKSLFGRTTRRQFIGKSAGVALAIGGSSAFLAACGAGSSSGGEVNVLSWASYVDSEENKLWAEAHPDIKLNTVVADADQTMFTKLKAGGAGSFDIVFANAGWTPTYYKNNLIETIDLKDIPSSKQLYPVFKENTEFPYVMDKDKVLLYPNMWAPLGMIWNTNVDYQPTPPYSWSQLWDPSIPDNKVILSGGAVEILSMAGVEQGVPLTKILQMKGAELENATNRLIELKPFQVNPYAVPQFRNQIRTEEGWIGYSPDMSSALLINQQAGSETAKNVIPEQGTAGWIDGPMLVKGAKNRENALKYIDWFASDQKLLTYMWDQYGFAQANQDAVKRAIDRGGDSAKLAKAIGADKPDTVKQIALLGLPDDNQAWNAAWDKITGQ